MKTADAAIEKARNDAVELQLALKKIGVDNQKIAASIADVDSLSKSISKLRDTALETDIAASNIGVSPAEAAKSVAAVDSETRAVKRLRDAYIEAAVAEKATLLPGMGGGSVPGFGGRPVYRDPLTGRSVGGAIPMNAPARVIGTSPSIDYGANYGPHRGPTLVGGDAEWQRIKAELLRQQTAPNGALIMGAAATRRAVSGLGQAEEVAARNARAQAYLDRLEQTGGGGRRLFGAGGDRGYRGGGLGGGGGGGGRDGRRGIYDVPGPNFLAGVLPGGRRARPAAVLSGIGALLSTGPVVGPAAGGLALGASGAIVGVLGGLGTLALAFHGLSGAAFTTQKAFDALNPAQKEFVQTIRQLGAGLGSSLTQIAQSSVIPGITKALHSAFTPQSVSALQGGVGAFGGAISGGTQQLGKLFGSTDFASNFGVMLKQDAGYLRDMFGEATNLVDTFVHLSVAAGPFVNWLSKGTLQLTKQLDLSIKTAQGNGSLANYFDHAKQSLQALGSLLGQFGKLFGSVFSAVGFQGSLDVIHLFTAALKTVTTFVNANKNVIHSFFEGIVHALSDMNNALRGPLRQLSLLLNDLNKLGKPLSSATNGVLSLTHAIDALAAVLGLKFLGSLGGASKGADGLATKLGKYGVAGEAAVAGGAVATLLGSLKGLAGTVFAAAVIVSFVPASQVGQNILDAAGLGALGKIPIFGNVAQQGANLGSYIFGNPNGPFGPNNAAAAAHPGQWVNAQGQVVDANGLVQATIPRGQKGLTGPASVPYKPKLPSLSLPTGIAAQIAKANAGHGNVDTANARAYAYYNSLLKMPGLTPAQKTTIYNAQATFAPSPAFGIPGALGAGTATTYDIPNSYQLAIARASTTPGTKDDVRTLKSAISYLKKTIPGLSPTDQTTAYGIEQGFQSQIASIQGTSLSRTGNALLPPKLQKSLAAAQQRVDKAKPGTSSLFGSAEGMYKQAFSVFKNFAKPPTVAKGAVGPYQTKLTAGQEKAFRAWVAKNHVPFNVNAKDVDYDMRGYWLAQTGGQLSPSDIWKGASTHFPDAFKTPFDTRFSNQSMYSTANNPYKWIGNNLVDTRNKNRIAGATSQSPLEADQKILRGTYKDAIANITKQLKAHNLTQKQITNLTNEQTALTAKLATLNKQITAENKAQANEQKKILAQEIALNKLQAQNKFERSVDKILGIGPNAGNASLTQLKGHERNVLLGAARRQGLSVPANESIKGMIQLLQKNHDLTKAQISSLSKINLSIQKATSEHKKLSADEKANITERLNQINDTLKQNQLLNNYIQPGAHALTRGLNLSLKQRVKTEGRLAEFFGSGRALHGKSINGIPIANHTTTIHVHGAGKNAAQIAKEVANELQKSHRRNSTQTRGAQAGRNVGLG